MALGSFEERAWAFRPQSLWWRVDALALRRRLFQPVCEEWCGGICRPPVPLSRHEYQALLEAQGEHFEVLLREGWLGGQQSQVLLMGLFLVACQGFPPLPVMRFFLTWGLENFPELMAERLRPRPEGATPAEVISMFWDPPPKHLMARWENLEVLSPAYTMFGCGSWQEAARLPLGELLRRFYDEGQ